MEEVCVSRFEKWANDLGIVVEKSSAFNPISNGMAERHMQVTKRMLDIAKEEKVPVEEALAALRSCPSSVDSFSPSRLFYGRELRNPELPAINDGLEEELLGKQRQITKEDSRLKHNSQVSKTVQCYTLQVGDLVYLQNQRTKQWDCPATVQLVRPGGRSAYVLLRTPDQLYLHSHVYMRPRSGVSEDSAVDAAQDVESGPVSTGGADPVMTQQSLSQVVVTRPQVVGDLSMAPSIMRSDHKGKQSRSLSLFQLALAGGEQGGQSAARRRSKKSVKFFLWL